MIGVFLAISPPLRHAVLQSGLDVGAYLDRHSPYSYVAVAVAILGTMIFLARSTGARR